MAVAKPEPPQGVPRVQSKAAKTHSGRLFRNQEANIGPGQEFTLNNLLRVLV